MGGDRRRRRVNGIEALLAVGAQGGDDGEWQPSHSVVREEDETLETPEPRGRWVGTPSVLRHLVLRRAAASPFSCDGPNIATTGRRARGPKTDVRNTFVFGITRASKSRSMVASASAGATTIGVHPKRGRYWVLRTLRGIGTPPSGGKWNNTISTRRGPSARSVRGLSVNPTRTVLAATRARREARTATHNHSRRAARRRKCAVAMITAATEYVVPAATRPVVRAGRCAVTPGVWPSVADVVRIHTAAARWGRTARARHAARAALGARRAERAVADRPQGPVLPYPARGPTPHLLLRGARRRP